VIRFARVHELLLARYGPQGWWPATDPFEIMAGALLVQRTAWRNAHRAIAALKSRGLLEPDQLATARIGEIEQCVRGAGFFRQKAARLHRLARALQKSNGIAGLAARSTHDLRHWLLSRDGIGPETADAILLYAFGRQAVVIDEYLRRLTQRLLASADKPADSVIRQQISDQIVDVSYLNELHALVVEHAKRTCRAVPRCQECVLTEQCRTAECASDTELRQGVGDFTQNARE
jgi:endonuclease-3 related protein